MAGISSARRTGPSLLRPRPATDSHADAAEIAELRTQLGEATETIEAIGRAAFHNRSLIEAGMNPMATIGARGEITDVNAAAEQLTGYSRAELLDCYFASYATEPDRARAAY